MLPADRLRAVKLQLLPALETWARELRTQSQGADVRPLLMAQFETDTLRANCSSRLDLDLSTLDASDFRAAVDLAMARL